MQNKICYVYEMCTIGTVFFKLSSNIKDGYMLQRVNVIHSYF